jgi:lysophospholipase L1-like esterase
VGRMIRLLFLFSRLKCGSCRAAFLSVLLLSGLLIVGCRTASAPPKLTSPSGTNGLLTLFLVGDSTMANKPMRPAQPERGWGQMLPAYFQDSVRIVNLAANGRSSKSFRDEGRWQPVLDQLQSGDYVIIQFGHNDEKGKGPARQTEPFGSFKQNLERYVREVRERGGKPILATSIVRRTFDAHGGALKDTHGDYIVATRQVAAEQQVPLLDMQRDSAQMVQKLGPEWSKRLYMSFQPGEFGSLPEGLEDITHFNAYGASRMCDLAVEEMAGAVPDLAKRLKPVEKVTPKRKQGGQVSFPKRL